MNEKTMTEEELKEKLEKLTPEQRHILREKGTEAPYSGKYLNETKAGTYTCVVCGNELFPSTAKFESTAPGLAGWPSFDEALPGAIKFEHDTSMGMNRTEVVCAKCNSHLGHIFDDPEAKTGKHYCMNSVCLDLKEDK